MNTYTKTAHLNAPFSVPSPGDVFAGIGRTLALWQTRAAMRRHLMELDADMLTDIGLDRVAANREATKPFWRA